MQHDTGRLFCCRESWGRTSLQVSRDPYESFLKENTREKVFLCSCVVACALVSHKELFSKSQPHVLKLYMQSCARVYIFFFFFQDEPVQTGCGSGYNQVFFLHRWRQFPNSRPAV